MLGSNEELEHNMQQKDALLQNDALTNMTNRTSNSSSSSHGSEESDGPVPFKINFRGTVWRKSMVNPTKKTTAQIINTMNEKIYKLQDTKQVYTQYQRYRLLNITFGLSTMIPIFFTVITVDLEFNGNNPGLLNTLLMLGVWVTVASIVLDIMRYGQKLRYKKAINEIPKETNLVTSGQIWFLLMEIIVLMLVPLPWTTNIMIQSYDEDDDAEYFFHFNDILSVFITLRFFFITRMVLQGGQYMSPTVVRLSYFFGTRVSYTYAIKCLMRRHPIRTLFVSYFGSIIIFAYMIRICERPLILIPGNDTMQISDYWNSLWYVVVTMTTVGYGDFYAHTNFGRLVSFFCCTWGAIVISVMVVVFTNVLEMDPSEKKILIIMERLLMRKRLKVQAAIVLQSVGRFLFVKNMRNYTDIQLKPFMAKIRENLKKFSELNLRIKAMNDRDNTNEEMARQFEFMRHEMREIKQALSNLSTLVRNRNLEQAFPNQTPHSIPAKDIRKTIN